MVINSCLVIFSDYLGHDGIGQYLEKNVEYKSAPSVAPMSPASPQPPPSPSSCPCFQSFIPADNTCLSHKWLYKTESMVPMTPSAHM